MDIAQTKEKDMASRTKRTDVHAPSRINPEDYEWVGIEYKKQDGDPLGDAMELKWMREQIERHMKKTGGDYSNHEHGGNCHVCGAHCIYTVLFYHRPRS